jgi:hypothetical protein
MENHCHIINRSIKKFYDSYKSFFDLLTSIGFAGKSKNDDKKCFFQNLMNNRDLLKDLVLIILKD